MNTNVTCWIVDGRLYMDEASALEHGRAQGKLK